MAILEMWSYGDGTLQGYVYGDEKYDDGTFIGTKKVLLGQKLKEGNTVRTWGGYYKLGKQVEVIDD